MWIAITLFAAFMQVFRNAGQKRLGGTVHALVVTWVRFLFGLPLAFLVALFLLHDVSVLSNLSTNYLIYVGIAAVTQFIGALLGVMLLQRRNFAVGATLIKTETFFIAILGIFLLGDTFPILGWVALMIGMVGIFLITVHRSGLSFKTLFSKLDTPSAVLGTLSGLFFAFAALYIRKANLTLPEFSPFQQSILTLVLVLVLQTVLGGIYIAQKDRRLLLDVPKNLPACLFIGTTSMLGSFGWFTAYALQNATYVKTLGHIEIILAMILTWRYFKESISLTEYIAVAMIVVSAMMVMWL